MSAPRDSERDAEWERDFQRLREAYRHKLRRELAALDAELCEALESGMAPLELEAARRRSHRLKGTAATYRLDETSAALERIEEQLGGLLEAAPPDAASIWAEIEQLLQRARKAIA